MKSVALLIWLLTANGQEEVVVKEHYDDMPACERRAQVVTDHYARRDQRTRYLCHIVIEEVGNVDALGNPIEE